MNDSDLLLRLREQQPEAVQYLTEYYLPSIWRFVYVRAHGDAHLAEDITSETVLSLITAAEQEAVLESPIAWMRSVAHRKLMDHFRAAKRVKHLIERVKTTQTGVDSNDAVTQELNQERREGVRQVMGDLSEQHRLALEWKYIEKLSVREMADRWETSEKAVESILFRARREFRRQHQRQDDDEAPEPVPRRTPKMEGEDDADTSAEDPSDFFEPINSND